MKKLFVLYSLAILVMTSCAQNKANGDELKPFIGNMAPKEYQENLKANNEIILIDVRTPQEYASGNIAKAKNIDFYSPDFADKISKLDRKRPIYLYCKSGGRSGSALEILTKQGFSHAVNLQGGMMAWNQAQLPIETTNASSISDELPLDQYQKTIADNKIVLIDFYAPWCKPCMRMKPEIEKLETAYKKQVKILKLDYDKNPSVAKAEEILALPTIIVYKGGKKSYYQVKELNYSELENLIK